MTDTLPAEQPRPAHRPALPFAQRIPRDYQDAVIEHVAAGRSMRETVELLGNEYSRAAIYNWEDEDADFRDRMQRARALGRRAMADDQTAIADKSPDDDTAKVKKAELRIRTRQWLLERLEPETYSPRHMVDHQHTHRHELDPDTASLLSDLRTELRAERGQLIEGEAHEVESEGEGE